VTDVTDEEAQQSAAPQAVRERERKRQQKRVKRVIDEWGSRTTGKQWKGWLCRRAAPACALCLEVTA
jgi:hypothetical protein